MGASANASVVVLGMAKTTSLLPKTATFAPSPASAWSRTRRAAGRDLGTLVRATVCVVAPTVATTFGVFEDSEGKTDKSPDNKTAVPVVGDVSPRLPAVVGSFVVAAKVMFPVFGTMTR